MSETTRVDFGPYSERVTDQAMFAAHVSYLIIWSFQNGYIITLGEAARTVEQQRLHVNAGRSMTMNSKHIDRLAIDLNAFKNGKLCTAEEMEPMGVYWESLDEKNVWGGKWRTNTWGGDGKRKFVDALHFQRTR